MVTIDVTLKQHTVIEFLNSEGETLIHIHEGLKNIYWNTTVGCCLKVDQLLW